MAKRGPIPRQGILDIAPYVPGTSALPGARQAIKLSSNETPFGPSPRAVEAYLAAAATLSRYPDGSARPLREALAKLYGLDPARIVCGAGSDELLNLLAQAYLGPGDEAIYTEHGFLVYRIAILARGAVPVVAPEKDLTADVDAILARVTPRTRIVFIANPNNPTGTYLSFDEVKRLRAGLPDDVLLVLDAAYAEYVRRNDYEAGIELVATTHNTVMTRTFSKIYGLASLRLGWAYCPAPVADALNRIRGPFNVSGPAIAAGIAALEDQAHVQRHGRAQRAVARAHGRSVVRHRPWRDAERRQFPAAAFQQGKRQTGARSRQVPAWPRHHSAAGGGIWLSACAAHDHRHRGRQSRRARCAHGFHGRQRLSALMTKPLFDTLAIIGPGLIGSSIARAARAQGAARSIVATARSPKTRKRVAELGIADKVTETNAEAVEGADLVIVCVPVGVCGGVAKEIGPHLKPGAIVSDVGSVKGSVVRDMGAHLPKTVHFVPAHPVAGTEHSGPDAGFAELFENRWCILTPPEGTDPEPVEKLAAFWRLLGANVDTMTPEHHDLVLAVTSHLPHLIAYTIVGTADELETVTRSEVLKFSAGGFRDFTRIAASDPVMWRDVFLNNKEAVLEMLGRFNEDVAALTKAIRRGDGEALSEHFSRTRAIRRGVIEAGQDTPEADFGRPHGHDE